MNIIRRRGWEIPDRLATPEHLVFSRRAFVAGGATVLALAPRIAVAQRMSDLANLPDPTANLYPAKRNEKYALDRPITDEKINDHYNNFYEFNSSKEVADQAQKLPIRPWTVKIDGLVEKPMEVGIDDLIRKMTLEERTYRHRCVEAWSMAIAWTGFPVRQARRFRQAARRRRNSCTWKPSTTPRSRPVCASPGIRGPISKASPWLRRPMISPSLPPAPTAIRCRSSTARRCGWRCRGNTASSRSNRSCKLHLRRQAAEGHVGGAAAVGIRLLGERQSGGTASALEPGDRRS